MIKFVILAFAISAVHCQYNQQGGYHQPSYREEGHEDYYAEPHYSYEYSVHDEHTGDIKSAREQRKGEHTEGEYRLREPDGSYRQVQYHVEGKSGFLAELHREPSRHQPSYQQPSYRPSYQPSYHH